MRPNLCLRHACALLCGALMVVVLSLSATGSAAAVRDGRQTAPPQRGVRPPAPTTPSSVEKLGKDLLRVGNIKIDTARREIAVAGTVNEVQIVEFIASTKGGFKAYESAVELDAHAIDFNLALILIGLDKAHSVVPRIAREATPPAGDPVEVWVEWNDAGKPRRVRAEELAYNRETKRPLPETPWVYTGSTFVGDTNAYLADVDGVLIGFAHTPSAIIDSAAPVPVPYDAIRLNPALNLSAGTAVVVTVRALERKS